MLLNKLGSWFPYDLCAKTSKSTSLKVTRPVVLWLKEMVMMVSRRGSESNIKSDLGIGQNTVFQAFIKHFLWHEYNQTLHILPS